MDILVAEDDKRIQAEYMRLFMHMGYAARGVHTARAALNEIEHAAPQVLITDFDLGGRGSGIDVVVRALQRRDDCKVVLCSTSKLTALCLQTSQLPICAYIRKPLPILKFKHVVKSVLDFL